MRIKEILSEDNDINHAPKSVQDAALARDGNVIRYLTNPTPDQIIQAVAQDGRAIQWIKTPHKDLQRIAVNQNPYAIKFIKNPSVEVQLYSVKKLWDTIQYIKNPSDEVLIAAFEKDLHGRPLVYIKDKDTEFFNQYKGVFVKQLLQLIKAGWVDTAHHILKLLKSKNLDWSELKVIEKALKDLKPRWGN